MTEDEGEIVPRGAVRIGLLVEKLTPLTDYLTRFVPNVHWVTVDYADYDFIRRWPKAAIHSGFKFDADVVTWHGFIVQPTHKSEDVPLFQTDIEDRT